MYHALYFISIMKIFRKQKFRCSLEGLGIGALYVYCGVRNVREFLSKMEVLCYLAFSYFPKPKFMILVFLQW